MVVTETFRLVIAQSRHGTLAFRNEISRVEASVGVIDKIFERFAVSLLVQFYSNKIAGVTNEDGLKKRPLTLFLYFSIRIYICDCTKKYYASNNVIPRSNSRFPSGQWSS